MVDFRSCLITIGVVGLCLFGIPINLNDSKLSERKLMFQSYTKKFNKLYSENTEEYELRFQKFQESLKLVEKLNSQRPSESSAYYGLTVFSDLSQNEFKKHKLQSTLPTRLRKHSGHHVNAEFRKYHQRSHAHNHLSKRAVGGGFLPDKVDWRDKGAITEVNNQKDCGACWAFSTIQTVETMHFLKTRVLEKLSVQQAIDCAGNGNQGCDGGDTCSLLMWLADNQIKIEREKGYPLVLETQSCKLKKAMTGVQVASNFTCDYLVGDENTLLSLLALHGPVAVAVNALSWQYYLGGVIQFHCDGSPQNLNHAVQIIGYDLTAEIPHYIVRNSWGTTFGDKGYLYLAIGSNICALEHIDGLIQYLEQQDDALLCDKMVLKKLQSQIKKKST